MTVSILFVSACEKGDTQIENKNDIKYLQRAVQISSSNDLWGKYTLNLVYKNERLRSGLYINEKGIEVGYITITYLGETTTFSEYHYVAENPTNEDVERSVQLAKVIEVVSKNGVLIQEKIDLYGQVNDDDLDYYQLSMQKNICEYNEVGNLIIIRQTGDYKNNVVPHRINYSYNRDKLESELIYDYSQDNWMEIEKNEFIYNSELIQIKNYEMSNNTWRQYGSKKFTYSENQLTIEATVNDIIQESSTYEFDNNGFVSKIINNDVITTIEYESGHGNYSLMTSILKRLSGVPFIK